MKILSGLKQAKRPENDIFIVQIEQQVEPSPFALSPCHLIRIALFVALCIGLSLTLVHLLQEERDSLQREFSEFVRRFDKTYATDRQREEAYGIFRVNMAALEGERRSQPDARFDAHQWMDERPERFRERFGVGDAPQPDLEGLALFEGFERPVNRPLEFSLRDKATPVKNQGSCGSCWAFATVASVETANARAGNTLVALSEQEMIECDSRNSGCRGGVRSYAMSFVVQTGLVPEAAYPYTGKEGVQCHIAGNATRVRIRDFRLLSQSEDAMADWLYTTGPITFGMNVTRSLYSYQSGVYRPSEEECRTKSEGSHALTIMGYGSERGVDYWLVKNSWGDYWGDGGYMRLSRGGNVCGMANNVVAPMF